MKKVILGALIACVLALAPASAVLAHPAHKDPHCAVLIHTSGVGPVPSAKVAALCEH